MLDDHTPIRKINLRQSIRSKFITAEIRHVTRERDRFKKTCHKTRHQTDWENYRQARNRVVSMRRKAVQEHFGKVCEDRGGDRRKFWSTVKPYIFSRDHQFCSCQNKVSMTSAILIFVVVVVVVVVVAAAVFHDNFLSSFFNFSQNVFTTRTWKTL